jgi:hypothetical protein
LSGIDLLAAGVFLGGRKGPEIPPGAWEGPLGLLLVVLRENALRRRLSG